MRDNIGLCRGKRPDNKTWVEGYYTLFPRPMIIIDAPELIAKWYWFDVDPSTVGQYTGLMDASGKRIFEGDICVDRRGFRFVVVWDDNARFLGRGVGAQQEYIRYVGQEPAVEIIGNIHDNPELAGGMQTSGEEPAP